MTVYILSYNSYFNRIVKKYDTLDEYIPYVIYTESQLNFNPADGCDTQFVAGRQGNPYDGTGNYLIYSEDNINITSRWFIIDQTRNLRNQYTITLHRDVIVDEYNNVMDADMVVQSAILSDSDPLIYNAEPITVNQIKQNETPLMDKTRCPWIVGYFDKKITDFSVTVQPQVYYQEDIESSYDNWQYKSYVDNTKVGWNYPGKAYNPYISSIIRTEQEVSGGYKNIYYYDTIKGSGSRYINSTVVSALDSPYYLKKSAEIPTPVTMYSKFISYNVAENIKNKYTTISYDVIQYFYSIAGKTLRFSNSDGTYDYYKCSLKTSTTTITDTLGKNDSVLQSLGITDAMKKMNFNTHSDYKDDSSIKITLYNLTQITLQMSKLNLNNQLTGKIDSNHDYCPTATYGLFAIPYGNYTLNIGGTDYTTQKDAGFKWAQKCFELGGGTSSSTQIYDVQLLPYCPIQELLNSDGKMIIDNSRLYSFITDENGNFKSIILYPQSDSFTFDIPFTHTIGNVKMESICDMYRLCSPNYNGQFEFNIAKNGGITKFNVDCTYIPYNPYIHMNPDFGMLYGSDFNDARGLICQGDFSLPVMNSAWISYQYSNKNYENIFQRQLSNMETNRAIQRKQETISIYTNALTAASSGAIAGSMVGGGKGSGSIAGGLIGGVLGAGVSIAAGYADLGLSDKLYSESVSYAKDNHNLELDNIKAMPSSIGKTTALTNNNKIFPILEQYSCTPEEKNYVANKIALNSMSVGVTGKLTNYINNVWEYNDFKSKGFLKGKLLHADIEQDSHYITTLAHELELGGYFTWE